MKQLFEEFWQALDAQKDPRFTEWRAELPGLVEEALHPEGNGNLPRWLAALETIQQFPTSQNYDLNQSAITANDFSLSDSDKTELTTALKALMPWRKGPYNLQGIEIDTEWRSDWKWDRVRPHLPELEGKRILDIGCGSGYHLWRMAGEAPELVVGVDPSLLFLSQFLAVRQFVGKQPPVFFLPLTLEQLPTSIYGGAFDFVFSMGVLYHRRSPIDHIIELKNQIRPGGHIVLETLIVPDSFRQLLVPEDRYAQMRNVWFLPSKDELALWLRRCGFQDIECVDIDQTSLNEQRSTDWMQWNSLKDFLDPNDPNLTIEGYPAPLRAVMVAKKPK